MEQRGLNLDGSLRYGGGEIKDITAEQMKNNVLAVQQLINNHNLIASELNRVRESYDGLLRGSAHILNRPEIAMLLNGFNVVGTIIVAIGVNMFTGTDTKGNVGAYLMAIGALMVVGSTTFHLFTAFRSGK